MGAQAGGGAEDIEKPIMAGDRSRGARRVLGVVYHACPIATDHKPSWRRLQRPLSATTKASSAQILGRSLDCGS
jgi:hypothetical protein